VDDNRFDSLTRKVGEQTDRRSMLKAATAGALGLMGLGVLGREALAQDVSIESKGYDGDKCQKNKDCKKGLRCDKNNNKKNGRCEYKNNCGGKKGDACKNNGDSCGGFKCKNKKCKKKN
jgi:hypothetical protein